MNEQEKFDDLLRSKLEERDFPFDETNWDKAGELIERSEKKRRIAIVGAIFVAGIGVGILLMLPFINNNKTPDTINVVSLEQKNNVTEQNKNSHYDSNSIADSKTSSEHYVANSTQENIAQNSQATKSRNSLRTDTTKQHKHTKELSSNTASQYSYVRPSAKKKDHRQVKAVYNPNNNRWVQNKAYTGSIDVADSDQQITEGNNNGSQTAITKKSSIDENRNYAPSRPTENNSAITNNTVQQSDPISTKNVIATNDSTSHKKDSSANTTQPIVQQPSPKQKKYSHTLLSADVGGGYSLGWKKENGIQGNGLSPIFGVSVTHYFSSTISALVGLQYNDLGNINTMYSNSTATYDFGTTTNVNSVTIKTLYYLSLPIKFQYNISSRNILSLGINMLYLVNTSSSVVSYNQNYFGVSGNTASTKMGYMDGINAMDAQLTLAYRRKINRFAITAEGYYGLLDIESNTFFSNNVFERNSGLRLILSYDIIK